MDPSFQTSSAISCPFKTSNRVISQLVLAMISWRGGRLSGAVFILLLYLASPGWAQWASSGLTGTVSDSSGHGVPGVEVTAVQDTTGLQRKAVSSAEGAYYFPKLPVGTYTVTFNCRRFPVACVSTMWCRS